MVSDKQLKEYAFKIYNKTPGYTIESVYDLSADYAARIIYYVNMFYMQDTTNTITKTNKTLQVLFYTTFTRFTTNYNKVKLKLERAMDSHNTGEALDLELKLTNEILSLLTYEINTATAYNLPKYLVEPAINLQNIYTQLRDSTIRLKNAYNNKGGYNA